MRIGTILSKRQLYLSKSELDAIGVKPGDRVLIQPMEDGSFMITAVKPQSSKHKKGGDTA